LRDMTAEQKSNVLYEKYGDNLSVANSVKDVLAMRNRADQIGLFITIGAFGMNEVCRITLRTPFFKLKPLNVGFWLLAPTLALRNSYNKSIDERVDNLWRIHKNREARNLGNTMH